MLPTSTNMTFRLASTVPAATDAIALFLPQKTSHLGPETALLPDAERAAAQRLLSAKLAQGKPRQVVSDVIDLPGNKHRQVLVTGLGDIQKLTPESIRESAGALLRSMTKRHIRNVAIAVPLKFDNAKTTPASTLDALVSGLLLAAFNYEECKGSIGKKKAREKEEEDGGGPIAVSLLVPADQIKKFQPTLDRARVIADAQNFARTIASRPGNKVNPPELARIAQQAAKELKLTCRILDEKQLATLGMGGILAVGAASATPPRMIVLEYAPQSKIKNQKSKIPLLVVGKALTFDAGGISIKPADKMGRMVFDKCGAMAVLGLMYAASKLKLPVHVVGILSSAENTLSGKGYRPGDILRMYNGVTVEVTNTDAEGRLVLGDALAYGIETYKPAAVVDLATLTGGVVVALGRTMAGVMSNNDPLLAEIQKAADAAGEKIWRLPVGDEHREMMKSHPADIVNSAGRDASPLQGAAFLSFFVPENTPWVHLDIAGVADSEKDLPYYAKGATGWGVRTLVEWIAAKE